MCQITVTNLHNARLNERLWLLLGSLGSEEKHKDGWGIANDKGEYFKCGIPMHWTLNSGEKISPVANNASMLLGHIRDASPRVPVNDENAHPFELKDVVFVHNGKLTPFDESQFVMEEDAPDIDTTTYKQKKDKNGALLTKKVGRSDSLIFFEEFMKDWESVGENFQTQDDKFTYVVNETMKKFYGKFAMVFIINHTFYICRGRTADLHISYLLKEDKKDADVLGWVINTSKSTLNMGSLLLSNLNALDGAGSLPFTIPVLLEQDSIFVAEDLGLRKIGELKERYAPAKVTAPIKSTNIPNRGSKPETFTKTGETEDRLVKVTRQIYEWMMKHSMSPTDIQILLYRAFGTSILEISVEILEAFYNTVLLGLSEKTNKTIRKAVKKRHSVFVSLWDYTPNHWYPWMLNNKDDQLHFSK